MKNVVKKSIWSCEKNKQSKGAIMNLTQQRKQRSGAIVEAVNNKLGLDLSYIKNDNMAIFAKDDKGFRYVIAVTLENHVRGVIRQRWKHRTFSYLPNGQTSKGGFQVGGPWNEGDFVVE